MDLKRLAKLLNVPKLGACTFSESYFELNGTLWVRLRDQVGGRSISVEIASKQLPEIIKLIKADIVTLQKYADEISKFLQETEKADVAVLGKKSQAQPSRAKRKR